MDSSYISLASFLLLLLMSLNINPINSKLFKICNSPNGVIKSINISVCNDEDSFCQLKKGEHVSLNMTFVSETAVESVKVKIYGEIAKVPLPFIVIPDEACGNYGLTCPLVPGQVNHFNLAIPIKHVYPSIPVVININLMDGDSKVKLACFKFKARISN